MMESQEVDGRGSGLPGITVVIVSYNHGRFLEQALDSVRAQTVRPTQLIVADDASPDDSAVRIERWLAANWPDAVFVRHEVNTGLPRLLNEVLTMADQDLLVMAAADDWMEPERLERQAAALAGAPDRVGLVYSDMTVVDEDGVPTGVRYYDYAAPPVEGDAFAAMLEASVPASPTVMLRRAAIVEAGPFDETLLFEDWDMWLRLSRLVDFAYLPAPLVNYRRVAGSLSRSDAYRVSFGEASIHVLRKHLGVSDADDRVIARRTGQIAQALYRKGRSPRATAADLRFSMRRHPTARGLVVLALATARVPGTVVVRATARLRRLVPGR